MIISEFNAGSMERLSGITPADYLSQIRGLGYRLAIVADPPIDAADNAAIIDYVRRSSHTDHIDILCTPRQGRRSF